MITSIIRHILFVQYILLNFHKFSISVKTYQVRRINASSYLVTSFPDSEFETFSSKAYEPKDPVDKTVFFNPVNDPLITEGLEDGYVGKPNVKLSASYINKARDNYFKHYYDTKKPVITNAGLPSSPTQDLSLFDYESRSNLDFNLLKARNLASVLISESQYPNIEGKSKDKSVIKRKNILQRPRRRYHRKPLKNPYI